MSKIKQIAESLKEKKKLLEETRGPIMMIAMQDAFALIADRVQNTGIAADGSPFPPYSDKEHHWAVALLDPSRFNAPNKIKKFKEDVKKGKARASYKALRRAYGLPDGKRTLTFDGAMFKSIAPVIVAEEEGITAIELRGKDQLTNDKIIGNSINAKSYILALSEDERSLLRDINLKRIRKIFEK